MKKLITALFCSVIGVSASAQWTPTAPKVDTKKRVSGLKPGNLALYYKLDLDRLKSQLKDAQESGPNSKPVYISLPTLEGKVERFAVYSFPVVVKELADQYQLGSYAGVSVEDPTKFVRFSLAPNDFQSMMSVDGQYEFIDAQDSSKTVYVVHPKSNNPDGKAFACSTSENPVAVAELNQLKTPGSSFANQFGDFGKSSDKKYRTMRLAMSATGEYTAFHGGTKALAFAAINATMTRVNFVFEKDLALHLNVQNFPDIIYLNAATDPYTNNLNFELQQVLSSSVVGNANYDIGHVFNAAGNNGNAGCIGCVCIAPTSTDPTLQAAYGKGSAFTQSTSPMGDTFDIDFVAHEMGHQLGARHTFAHALENGSVAHVEPGSGSTIMGYAGITGGPSTDVQLNSDPYFHRISITQIQNNLIAKTCDIETNITNNPPVIAPLSTFNIPKGTAFVLTASVTDPENNPMTYTWEQVNNSSVVINSGNLGNTTTGASFRSLAPTTSPTRYFPKLSSVLAGILNNSNNQWESVSNVARTTTFAITARDNNPIPSEQQTQSEQQSIIVGNDGPFKINDQLQYGYVNTATAILWDVVNTNSAPYLVDNVKIDYTADNGTTWNTLIASTANDGSENFTFPSTLNNQAIKLRISALGNVFYAVKSIFITTSVACGSAPSGVLVSNITSTTANVNWAPVTGAASYIIRYKKTSDTTWQQVTSTTNTAQLSSLSDASNYEVQVSAVCGNNVGPYSPSTNFTTLTVTYCPSFSNNGQLNYISNLTLGTVNNTTTGSTYSDFTANPALQPTLSPNSTNNAISTTINVVSSNAATNAMAIWIDFNKNGVFEASERVLNMPVTTLPTGPTTVNGVFSVPSTAITNSTLRMRVVTVLINPTAIGLSIPDSFACGNFPNGEVEDYNVIVTSNLSTGESAVKNNGIQIYPNPATDFLNVTKVSDKATYKIYSSAGQLVSNGNIVSGKINVSSLIKGAYVIFVEDKGREAFTSKFIKK
ncbi:reprolysin-like metallopeptidase [Chryseobacterium zhengzhouense]|uniref:Reprolysin-like metallopeptidase n=1 Tax=Chryseobacterium zhengzhouense TaxID=1636086 RepID=A0ABW2LZK9_9FLAO